MDYLIYAWNVVTEVWEVIHRETIQPSSEPPAQVAYDLTVCPIYAEEFGGVPGVDYLVSVHDQDDVAIQTQLQRALSRERPAQPIQPA